MIENFNFEKLPSKVVENYINNLRSQVSLLMEELRKAIEENKRLKAELNIPREKDDLE